MAYPLGSEKRPLVLKVASERRLKEVTEVCEKHGFKYIIGLENLEDITDLKKAIKEKMTPSDVYSLCSCGSGKKYKFCCANKANDLDI
jgi:hypothetical protein